MNLTDKQKSFISNVENIVRHGLKPSEYEKIYNAYQRGRGMPGVMGGWEEAKKILITEIMKR